MEHIVASGACLIFVSPQAWQARAHDFPFPSSVPLTLLSSLFSDHIVPAAIAFDCEARYVLSYGDLVTARVMCPTGNNPEDL